MYTSIPEPTMPERSNHWRDAVLLKEVKYFFVVIVYQYGVAVYGKHVDLEHSFFHVSYPVFKISLDVV